jgi:hypothetical protein
MFIWILNSCPSTQFFILLIVWRVSWVAGRGMLRMISWVRGIYIEGIKSWDIEVNLPECKSWKHSLELLYNLWVNWTIFQSSLHFIIKFIIIKYHFKLLQITLIVKFVSLGRRWLFIIISHCHWNILKIYVN